MRSGSRWALALAMAAAVCGWACAGRVPRAKLFPAKLLGDIDRARRLAEPSGIALHPLRKTLIVVGDEGDVYEIDLHGTVKQHQSYKNRDIEGVAADPKTGRLYVAVEGQERILELASDDLSLQREFEIPRTFKGELVFQRGGHGIESIAFVPRADHPEGGTFFVANQTFGLPPAGERSVLVELELPLKTGEERSAKAKILRVIDMRIIDISDLHYHAPSGHLWMISDKNDAFFELDLAGAILRTFRLPGNDQEGITTDDAGNVYIAQDCGGVLKLKFKGFGQ